MLEKTIFDTSEICYQLGVKHAVFSPGSRNAPLSISFNRNKNISTRVIVDERSAGFIALGIAEQTNSPVVLCCTSGTALLNYGPAIAEAYYQNIPLIILSADRPQEWIDQWDGQTIHQENIFTKFTKSFFQLPVDTSTANGKWEFCRKLSQGINESQTSPKGPVHFNLPFSEPFYPTKGQNLRFSKDLPIIKKPLIIKNINKDSFTKFLENWGKIDNKIVVAGQGIPDDSQVELLQKFCALQNVPLIADIISNYSAINDAISNQDLFLQDRSKWEKLSPKLILTFGKSVISKNLKLFLRNANAIQWHVDPDSHYSDPFQSLRYTIGCRIDEFIESIMSAAPQPATFKDHWIQTDRNADKVKSTINDLPYSEFYAFSKVLEKMPEESDVLLANSMPIRYANFVGVNQKKIKIFANRGTSGIDGTNGTAVGLALETNRKVILLTGDLSYLYDRNAFLHEYDLSNLYVIVFNNFGGGIFNLISGPDELPDEEKAKHFTSSHNKNIKLSALDGGFTYLKCNDEITLELSLSEFFKTGNKPKLLEIQSNPTINKQVFFKIKEQFNG